MPSHVYRIAGVPCTFHVDDLDTIPPDGGGGLVDLRCHWIFWYIYRTKVMDHWLQQTYVCYHDGFMVPMYRGRHHDETSGELRFEVHMPKYEFQDRALIIVLEDPFIND